MINQPGYNRDVANAAEWITSDGDMDQNIAEAAVEIAADYHNDFFSTRLDIVRAIAARDAR